MMAFLGIRYSASEQIKRLDEATADNLAAQEGLQQVAQATAETTRRERRHAMAELRRTQLALRALRGRTLQTSAVREAVEEALRDMDHSADHRAQSRH